MPEALKVLPKRGGAEIVLGPNPRSSFSALAGLHFCNLARRVCMIKFACRAASPSTSGCGLPAESENRSGRSRAGERFSANGSEDFLLC